MLSHDPFQRRGFASGNVLSRAGLPEGLAVLREARELAQAAG